METPEDAALGLPVHAEDQLEDPYDYDMLGATPPINAPTAPTPAPAPSRTDESNVLSAKHKAAIAYARLLRSLATQEQKDAACDYMAAELEVMGLLEGGAA